MAELDIDIMHSLDLPVGIGSQTLFFQEGAVVGEMSPEMRQLNALYGKGHDVTFQRLNYPNVLHEVVLIKNERKLTSEQIAMAICLSAAINSNAVGEKMGGYLPKIMSVDDYLNGYVNDKDQFEFGKFAESLYGVKEISAKLCKQPDSDDGSFEKRWKKVVGAMEGAFVGSRSGK